PLRLKEDLVEGVILDRRDDGIGFDQPRGVEGDVDIGDDRRAKDAESTNARAPEVFIDDVGHDKHDRPDDDADAEDEGPNRSSDLDQLAADEFGKDGIAKKEACEDDEERLFALLALAEMGRRGVLRVGHARSLFRASTSGY